MEDGDRHFHQRQHGADGGKGGQHEEDDHQQMAEGHAGEHGGNGLEQQRRAARRIEAEREHGREDGQAGQHGHGQVGQHHGEGGARNVLLLAEVAAVDGHAAHAERELEEGQPQRLEQHLAINTGKIGQEQEAHALHGAGQHQGGDGHQHQQAEQQRHQALGDGFDATADAEGDDDADQQQHQPLPAEGCGRIAYQAAKGLLQQAAVLREDAAADALAYIGKHPADHGRVEGHDQQHGDQAQRADDPPQGAGRQLAVHADRVGARAAAQADLGNHQRQADQQGGQQIDQQKAGTAVVAGLVGKHPDVAETDGRTEGGSEHAEAGTEAVACGSGRGGHGSTSQCADRCGVHRAHDRARVGERRGL